MSEMTTAQFALSAMGYIFAVQLGVMAAFAVWWLMKR